MSELKVIIHPQALLQISDHVTRSKYFTQPIEYICGVIYGSSDGVKVEISSTVESLVVYKSNTYMIDSDSYNALDFHHKQNFPGETPIGWYIVNRPNPEMVELLNSAFRAKFDVMVRAEYLDENNPHPLRVIITNGEKWIEVPYSYESETAERVALVQLQAEGNAESQKSFAVDAFNAMNKQLEIIENYIIDVKEGRKEFNCELVRQASTVARYFRHYKLIPTSEMVECQSALALLSGVLAEVVTRYEQQKIAKINSKSKRQTQPVE